MFTWFVPKKAQKSPFGPLNTEHAHIVRIVVELDVKSFVSQNVANVSPAMLTDTSTNGYIESIT